MSNVHTECYRVKSLTNASVLARLFALALSHSHSHSQVSLPLSLTTGFSSPSLSSSFSPSISSFLRASPVIARRYCYTIRYQPADINRLLIRDGKASQRVREARGRAAATKLLLERREPNVTRSARAATAEKLAAMNRRQGRQRTTTAIGTTTTTRTPPQPLTKATPKGCFSSRD